MKGLALEIIFKWVILLVIGLVVIGMIFFFSDSIKNFLENFLQGGGTGGGMLIESSSFSTSQVKTFIKACWYKYPGNYSKETICYVLKGDVNAVDSSSLAGALDSEELVDKTNFDNSKSTTIIKKVGRKIVIESLT